MQLQTSFWEKQRGGTLTSTWARRYKDYPSAQDFGYLNGNLEKEEYREGIYVGYRYFDTFSVKPLFSFGYRPVLYFFFYRISKSGDQRKEYRAYCFCKEYRRAL